MKRKISQPIEVAQDAERHPLYDTGSWFDTRVEEWRDARPRETPADIIALGLPRGLSEGRLLMETFDDILPSCEKGLCSTCEGYRPEVLEMLRDRAEKELQIFGVSWDPTLRF